MNKEQWVFVLSLALFAYGLYSAATRWIPEKQFHPPAAGTRAGGPKVEAMEPPVFASEDEGSQFREGGRDPFQPKPEVFGRRLAVSVKKHMVLNFEAPEPLVHVFKFLFQTCHLSIAD